MYFQIVSDTKYHNGVALWYVLFLFMTVKVKSFWILLLSEIKCRPPILYMSLIINMLKVGADVLQKDAEPSERMPATPKRNLKLPLLLPQ